MGPSIRIWERRLLHRYARARQAGVGDERVEAALAVVVDAQPDHVPARVVGIADPEDREGGWANRLTRSPEERQGAALRVDVPRRPVRQQLRVAALQARSLRSVGDDLHVVHEVRFGGTLGMVGRQSPIAGEVEQQSGLIRRLHRDPAAGQENRDPDAGNSARHFIPRVSSQPRVSITRESTTREINDEELKSRPKSPHCRLRVTDLTLVQTGAPGV